jgi:hypothetical protein
VLFVLVPFLLSGSIGGRWKIQCFQLLKIIVFDVLHFRNRVIKFGFSTIEIGGTCLGAVWIHIW